MSRTAGNQEDVTTRCGLAPPEQLDVIVCCDHSERMCKLITSILLMSENIMSPLAPPYFVASSPDVFFRNLCPISRGTGRIASSGTPFSNLLERSPDYPCPLSALLSEVT